MKILSSQSLRRLLAVGALLALLAGTSGCVAVVAGASAGAAVAYVRGQLETTLGASYDDSVEATTRALQDMGIAKVSERKDALVAVIVARNAEDKKIEIRLDNLARDLTKIRIRVGVFGNEALSIAILERIKTRL